MIIFVRDYICSGSSVGIGLCSVRVSVCVFFCCVFCCLQAEDGIRDLVRSRGLGDVYKRQGIDELLATPSATLPSSRRVNPE